MNIIDLEATPNQSVTFAADGQQYNLTIRSVGDRVYMDVTMNGAVVATALKCLVGQIIMPYSYLEGGVGGNFIFNTTSGNDPQYANFGSSDILLYASVAELASVRGS